MATSRDAVKRRRTAERFAGPAAGPTPDPGPVVPAADASDRWLLFLLQIAILALATLWIYSPAYHGDWLWDDDQSVTKNAVTQSPWSWKTFTEIWIAPPGADYFPLSAMGFWAPWQIWGPKPGMNPQDAQRAFENVKTAYHVVNVVLHILGALAFWRLLHVLKLPGAWLGGMLFAIHPVCVESVAWVSELKNTLSQPLFLLACASFVQFDDDTDAPAAELHYLAAMALFLLAMLTKTSLVMFPFVILIYGWWKHGFTLEPRGLLVTVLAAASLSLTVGPILWWLVELRNGRSSHALMTICWTIAFLGPVSSVVLALAALLPDGEEPVATDDDRSRGLERTVLRALPFFWISAVLGLATCYFQWTRAIGQEPIPVGGIDSRIAMSGMGTLFYLWKTLVPFNLMTIYPRWEVDPPKLWQFLPWPVMIAALWWLWQARGTAERPTWQRHVLFAAGYFVLMLLPVLGFITISYMRITWVADHFVYNPMLAVIGLVAAAGGVGYARLSTGERLLALAATTAVLVLLGAASFRYAHAWAGEETLWPHTIAGHLHDEKGVPHCRVGCGCWQAHNRLGAKKYEKGLIDEAHFHFQNSTRLRPNLGETHNNLGTTLSQRAQAMARNGDQVNAKREMDLAIEQFEEACRVTPNVPAMGVNCANAMIAAGRFADAGKKFAELIEKDPKGAQAYRSTWAQSLAMARQFQAAGDVYEQMLKDEPKNPVLLNNYGVTLYRQGLKEESIVQFKRAIEIDPNFKDARESLLVATGEKPDPGAMPPLTPEQPPPIGPQPGSPAQPPLQLQAPQSPTLGPPRLP